MAELAPNPGVPGTPETTKPEPAAETTSKMGAWGRPSPTSAWNKGSPEKAAVPAPHQPSPTVPAQPAVRKSWAELTKVNQAQEKAASPAEKSLPNGEAAQRPSARAPVSESGKGSGVQSQEKVTHKQSTGVNTSKSEEENNNEKIDKEEAAVRIEIERLIDGAMVGSIVERRLRGLNNAGNLCFVNAVLQCLASCQPLFRFLAGLHNFSVPAKMKTLVELVGFIAELVDEEPELGADLRGGSRKAPIKGSLLKGVVNEWVPDDPVRPSGGKARQEDAQEFLSYLLNALHNELAPHSDVNEAQAPASSHETVEETTTEAADEDGWLQVGGKSGAKKTAVRKMREKRTLVTALFGGEWETVIKYSGNWASAVREPFTVFPLDIRLSDVKSVEHALDQFLQPEKLNMKDNKNATKQVRVTVWPEVLILHLKRFTFDEKGTQKILKKVAFPEKLTVQSEISSTAKPSDRHTYSLTAVVLHHGKQPHEGHYTAMVRHETQRGDAWVGLDDEYVSNIALEDVLAQQQQAYLLFYRLVST